jgi:hypothetical protein
MRSAFMPSRMYFSPLPSSPIRLLAGMRILSKKISVVLWFTMAGSLRISSPLPFSWRMSTRKTDRPSLLRAQSSSGVVRASSSIRSEYSAREVQTFWPLTT